MYDRLRFAVRSATCVVAWCAAACSFDASGTSMGGSLSVGEAGSAPADGSGDSDGDSDSDGDGDGGHDGGSSGLPPEGCVDGSTCAAPAPAGWSGPFAIASAAPPDGTLACPQGWTQQAAAFRDLQAQPATCGCECVPTPGLCNVTVDYYSDSGCTDAIDGTSFSGGCQGMSALFSHGYVSASVAAVGVSCAPSPSKMVPPVAWGTGSLLCSPPVAPPCDDGPCVPAVPPGFDGRWCVMADGELPCPAGEYGAPIVVHRDVVDTRDCSVCNCNVQGAPSCGGSLTEFHYPLCAYGAGMIALDGVCHSASVSANDAAWSVNYDGAEPMFTCANGGSAPSGAATPTDTLTLCCTA